LLGGFLSNSAFCWAAGAAAVIAWHIPVLFNLAMSSHTWHIVEDASFLSAGLLFWRPIIRHWSSDAKPPQWSMPLYLFLATLPCDILSAFLTFCDRVVYPSYVSAARMFNISPLQDQECAGALMWVCVTFVYLIPAVVITMQILGPSAVDRQRKAPGVLSRLAVAKVSVAETEIL
jgi:cytochrome c oxidase assembly factor CtaG